MVAMKRTVLALSLLWVLAGTAPASAAFLGENPRLGESFPNTTLLRVSEDVSRELPPGSGGSCLERPAECFVAPSAPVKEGIYEFPDQQAGGTPYVGQSGNVPGRLGQHESAGRLTPGTESTTEVLGGKTAREIAEHNRIQELTGGQRAANSPAVSNQRDPIGPNRRPGFGLPEPTD
jgi:hypothetical protein